MRILESWRVRASGDDTAMVDWDDFDFELESQREPDQYQLSAREELADFFETNKNGVFFGNQLAIRHEDKFFHGLRLEP